MAYEDALDRLIRLRITVEKILENYTPERPQKVHLELSNEEIKQWLKNEPNFTKQIAKPLRSRLPPPDKLPVYPIGGVGPYHRYHAYSHH
jgi:hypothetical protein